MIQKRSLNQFCGCSYPETIYLPVRLALTFCVGGKLSGKPVPREWKRETSFLLLNELYGLYSVRAGGDLKDKKSLS